MKPAHKKKNTRVRKRVKNLGTFPVGSFVNVEKIRVNKRGTIDVIVRDRALPAKTRVAMMNAQSKKKTRK